MFSRKNQIIILTVITAGIHFARAAADPGIRTMFLLNGVGYLVLAWAYFAPQMAARKKLVSYIYLGYTVVTILFYGFYVATSGDWTLPLGPIDKIVELALVVLLWQDKE